MRFLEIADMIDRILEFRGCYAIELNKLAYVINQKQEDIRLLAKYYKSYRITEDEDGVYFFSSKCVE